ncbi:MAG: hypothetical protein HY862_04795 [Chloroflexi bacterium]|nr:hypothetical protein [Chloroflexota bacterium]
MLSSFYEINFDRYFSSDELTVSIAQIFGVAPSQVLVITGSADDYLTKDILILVTVTQVEGGVNSR